MGSSAAAFTAGPLPKITPMPADRAKARRVASHDTIAFHPLNILVCLDNIRGLDILCVRS